MRSLTTMAVCGAAAATITACQGTAAVVPQAMAPKTSAAPPRATTVPTTTASATTPAAAPAAADCTIGDLTVAYNPLHGVAAGTSFADLVVTNATSTACDLDGWLSIQYTDSAQEVIAVSITPPQTTDGQIPLAPGGSAAELVSYGSDGNPPPGQQTCTPVETDVQVSVAGQTGYVTVAIPTRGHCPNDGAMLDTPIPGTTATP